MTSTWGVRRCPLREPWDSVGGTCPLKVQKTNTAEGHLPRCNIGGDAEGCCCRGSTTSLQIAVQAGSAPCKRVNVRQCIKWWLQVAHLENRCNVLCSRLPGPRRRKKVMVGCTAAVATCARLLCTRKAHHSMSRSRQPHHKYLHSPNHITSLQHIWQCVLWQGANTAERHVRSLLHTSSPSASTQPNVPMWLA